MTIRIEHPNGKVEIFSDVIKITSAGILKKRAHGIDINSVVLDRANGGTSRIWLSEIQHFEISEIEP